MSTAKAPAAPSDRICEKHGTRFGITAARLWHAYTRQSTRFKYVVVTNSVFKEVIEMKSLD